MSKKVLAVLILAAGSSKRLGQAKQLVKYKDESLLEVSVKKALNISKHVFVVLGHEKEKCEKEILKYNVQIIYNKEYEKGIGSSISLGISHTRNFEKTLILLCDQPFIPSSHLACLVINSKKNTIIASSYEGSQHITVPAIFPQRYYKKLLRLQEDKGAKSILNQEFCMKIELSKKFAIDIDTKEDIKRFL